ncbi:transposase [Knoellia sp. CPCC 206450]|uniref:transposase n=1 Tax=Knoellia tibetensis TaxID=3404798 RepID=UPI003B42CF4D
MLADETVAGGGRFDTTVEGYEAMLDFVAGWPERVWAIEGCEGIGRHIAHRLLADGQDIVDVPAKLSARARVFASGRAARPTPPTRTRSHWSAPAWPGCDRSSLMPSSRCCSCSWTGAARSGDEHTRKISQLHRILLEMLPGGAKKYLSAAQAKVLLAGVRPRDAVGKTRKRVAAELVADLERIHARKKAADKELKDLVAATGTSLLGLHGIGPSGAARLLVEVGDLSRFPDRNHFASWTGTAPIDASSGDHVRHRLSRGGNRQINRVLHIMATVQLRTPTRGPRVLRPEESRRQNLHGSHALPQTAPVRPRLPNDARRLHREQGDGPGRATGQRL